jgi:hypothetical protein
LRIRKPKEIRHEQPSSPRTESQKIPFENRRQLAV